MNTQILVPGTQLGTQNKGLGAVSQTDLTRAQLFKGRLPLNPVFSFLCSKVFPQIIFSVIFRAFNHQLVDKKN